MSTVARRSPVYRQLEAYAWAPDPDEALLDRDWEDAIAVGLCTFRMIVDREQAWRDQVFRGVRPCSDDENLEHLGRFKNWLETTSKVLAKILPQLEQRLGKVLGAAELRACAACAETIVKEWQPPRLSAAVGLREMTLSAEAGAELDRILQAAQQPLPNQATARMQEMSLAEWKRRLRG